MRDQPPSRYRVVERDGLLVVIDDWAGSKALSGEDALLQQPRRRIDAYLPSLALEKTAFDGRVALTTHRFYDDKGPRTIMLTARNGQMILGMKMAAISFAAVVVFAWLMAPWLLILLPLTVLTLTKKKARFVLRTWITAWLDAAEARASGNML